MSVEKDSASAGLKRQLPSDLRYVVQQDILKTCQEALTQLIGNEE